MANCKVQVDATLKITLTLFECTTPPVIPKVLIDLSSQTNMEIVLLGPGAVRITKTPVFVTDGTDGQMTTVINAGEITVSGKWSVQGNAAITVGTVYSITKTFDVKDNI